MFCGEWGVLFVFFVSGGAGVGWGLLALSCEGGATWPTIFPFLFPKDFCEFLIYF